MIALLTKYQKQYDGVLKSKENAIYVYDLNGNKKTIYYIPKTYNNESFNEIENVSFDGDKIIVQFNQHGKAGYYTSISKLKNYTLTGNSKNNNSSNTKNNTNNVNSNSSSNSTNKSDSSNNNSNKAILSTFTHWIILSKCIGSRPIRFFKNIFVGFSSIFSSYFLISLRKIEYTLTITQQ